MTRGSVCTGIGLSSGPQGCGSKSSTGQHGETTAPDDEGAVVQTVSTARSGQTQQMGEVHYGVALARVAS